MENTDEDLNFLTNFILQGNGEVNENIRKINEETIRLYNNNFLDIVLFGDSRCGKTTMINSIIGALSEKYSNNVEIPKSGLGSSYFITIIQSSKDDDFHLFIGEPSRLKEYTFKDSKEINKILENHDNDNTEISSKIYECEDEKDEKKKKELKDQIHLTPLRILIPNFPQELKNVRFIDCPSLTNIIIKDKVFEFLQENSAAKIFIYLINIMQDKVTSMAFDFFKEEILKKYSNCYLYFSITQSDKLFGEMYKGSEYYQPDKDLNIQIDNTRNFNKKIDIFNNIRLKFNELVRFKNLRNCKVFINNNHYVLYNDPKLNKYPRQQVSDFIDHIKTIYCSEYKNIRINSFIDNLFSKLNSLNEQISNENILNDPEKSYLNDSILHLQSRYENWEKNYKIDLSNQLDRNEIELQKKRFYLRETYINEHIRLLKEKTHEVHNEFKIIMEENIKYLNSKISETLFDKFNKFFQERENCDKLFEDYKISSPISNTSRPYFKKIFTYINRLLFLGVLFISSLVITSKFHNDIPNIMIDVAKIINEININSMRNLKLISPFLTGFSIIFFLYKNLFSWKRTESLKELKDKLELKFNQITVISKKYVDNYRQIIKEFMKKNKNIKKINEEILKCYENLKKKITIKEEKNRIEHIDIMFQSAYENFKESDDFKSFLKRILLQKRIDYNKN